jgi:hypothetical protein
MGLKKVTETIEGKIVHFLDVEEHMVENVVKLIKSMVSRDVPLKSIVEKMEKMNMKTEVEGETPTVTPAGPVTEIVVESGNIPGDVLFEPESSEKKTAGKAKKRAAGKAKTGAKKVTKAPKKVKKTTKSKTPSTGKKRGRQPNLEKQTKAFELIRSMKADGKDVNAIVNAGMKLFTKSYPDKPPCSYPNFYYYLNLYKRSK